MPVGGSRHYNPGNGSDGVWACPSCGEDNSGPIAQGCVVCGAGRPGYKVDPQAPPPPPAPLTQREGDEKISLGMRWMHMHPDATVAEAFDAGFQSGVQAARQGVMDHARKQKPEQHGDFSPEGRMTRTILAALTLFKDQVLVNAEEEIATGEWASIDEVNAVLAKLRQELAREVARV